MPAWIVPSVAKTAMGPSARARATLAVSCTMDSNSMPMARSTGSVKMFAELHGRTKKSAPIRSNRWASATNAGVGSGAVGSSRAAVRSGVVECCRTMASMWS